MLTMPYSVLLQEFPCPALPNETYDLGLLLFKQMEQKVSIDNRMRRSAPGTCAFPLLCPKIDGTLLPEVNQQTVRCPQPGMQRQCPATTNNFADLVT